MQVEYNNARTAPDRCCSWIVFLLLSFAASYLSVYIKEGQLDFRLACHVPDVELVHSIRLSVHAALVPFRLSVLTGGRVLLPLAAAATAAAGGGGGGGTAGGDGNDAASGRRCGGGGSGSNSKR